MMFLLSHEPPQRLPSLYWRSQARLPTGHPLWPARRGTCPVQVLEAQEISGNSQRVGPPGQSMMRTGQAACERYREVSGQGPHTGYKSYGARHATEYAPWANENIIICPSIESLEGLQNVEEIAAVEGIDMIAYGHSDLSA